MRAETAHTPEDNNQTAIVRIKTLRLPEDLSDEITRRARMKGVPDADYYRLLIERGLLLESVEAAMEKPLPPAYWGLYQGLLETRNILRSLGARTSVRCSIPLRWLGRSGARRCASTHSSPRCLPSSSASLTTSDPVDPPISIPARSLPEWDDRREPLLLFCGGACQVLERLVASPNRWLGLFGAKTRPRLSALKPPC
jgi:hypothetical protein